MKNENNLIWEQYQDSQPGVPQTEGQSIQPFIDKYGDRPVGFGLTDAQFKDNILKIAHRGNMGNTVERSVDPNIKHLGLPPVGVLKSLFPKFEEKGSPDYSWVIKFDCRGA